MNESSAGFEPPTRTSEPSPREDGITLLRSFAILRRRWLVLILGFLTGGGAAVAFAMTRPQAYRSEATVEIGPEQPLVRPDGVGETLTHSAHLFENHLRTQETLLRRPGLLADVIESLSPEQAAPYKQAPDPALALSDDLDIDAVPSTFLIRITLNHDRKEHGPEIVNKLVDFFIDDSNRRLTELKNGAQDILSKQSLPVIKQRMDEAEQALWAFHGKIGFGDLEEQYEILLAEKRQLHDRLVAVRVRAIELKSSPESSVRSEPRAMLESRRTALEMEIAARRVELREKHPAMVTLRKQLEALDALLEESVESERERRARTLQALADEEQALAGEERGMTERIATARSLFSQFRGLEMEVASSRDLYNAYLKRLGEMKAMSGAGLTSVRIVDQAKHPRTSGARLQLILALGLVIGFPFGILAVFIAEQVDDRVPAPLEAERALGLELLAVIPRLESPPGASHLPVVPEDDPELAPLEPFRRLRSEVASRLQGIAGTKIVGILSPNYDEGKSTIAINFARVLALEGKRVLLFDVDLRQPGLKAFLGNRAAPGLEDYLEGKAVLDRCLQPSRIPGVDVLGATWEFAGSAEVPGSQRFRTLWTALRSHYDYVIVDTSPINVVSEAAVVASYADASIFVMEERRTSIRQALAALRRIGNHKVRPLGLVVNRSQATDFQRPEPERSRSEMKDVEFGFK